MDYKIQVKAGFICDNTSVLTPETKDMFSNTLEDGCSKFLWNIAFTSLKCVQ